MAVLKHGGARGKGLGPGEEQLRSVDGIYSGSLGKSFPGHSLSFPLHEMTLGVGWVGESVQGWGCYLLLGCASVCSAPGEEPADFFQRSSQC